jgi:ankyrin repeat protein
MEARSGARIGPTHAATASLFAALEAAEVERERARRAAHARYEGLPALLSAARRGRVEIVRALVAAGVDVSRGAPFTRLTALMLASRHGHLECVRTLLEAGADVEQADEDGWTALIAASHCGHRECVRALLAAGADPAQATDSGRTALIRASQRGHLECVRALLEAGADVEQACASGATPLTRAARHGHLECVRALLAAGADPAQATEDGWTALLHASQRGHLECVRALLATGADVAQACAFGTTALTRAALHGHVECVRALLEAGADVVQPHQTTACALEHAGHSLEMLQLLCAYAPSREAVRAHRIPRARLLPECAQWLDATSRWTSPLHHFELVPLERVRALLVAGADVRAGDGNADAPTPVGLAAARLLRGDGLDDGRAALLVRAAAPWSPRTHALFPAGAKARAVELLRIGWQLARRLQGGVADASQVEVAFRDAWLGHVMPHAIERAST